LDRSARWEPVRLKHLVAANVAGRCGLNMASVYPSRVTDSLLEIVITT
jgi:hypothetical protein